MIIVFLSNVVESVAGFGATILALTLGARFFPIEELIPILVPLNVLLSAYIVLTYRRDINWHLLKTRILPFTLIGMPIGIWIFRMAPGASLKLAFGVIVVSLGVFELVRGLQTQRTEPKPLGILGSAGFLIAGGIMQGLYASGGPFVVYYFSRTVKEKAAFRTTLSFLWLVLNILLIFSLVQGAQINSYTLQFSLYLLPFVLAGIFVGTRVHSWVSERQFKLAVYALLALAGLSLIYRSILLGQA